MPILGFLCVVLLGVGSTFWHFKRARTILQHWADKQGYRIIESRYALFNLGPFMWKTGRAQMVYRVKVESETGQIWNGWVRCGSWVMGVLSDEAEVKWDD